MGKLNVREEVPQSGASEALEGIRTVNDIAQENDVATVTTSCSELSITSIL